VEEAVAQAAATPLAEHPLVFRDPVNSKRLSAPLPELPVG
jgi:hypothetical protein